MNKLEKPYRYLVFVQYGLRPAETPDWAWDLAYACNDELFAISKYAELKMKDESNRVVLTKQLQVIANEVKS